MRIKPEIRIMGIDDGWFSKGDDTVLLVGVVFRGGFWIDGMVSTYISVDGHDATDQIVKMVCSSRYGDVRILMLSGITFGGFNVVDIVRLYEETGIPVIVVVDRKPDPDAIASALTHVGGEEERMRLMHRAGPLHETENKVLFQVCGIEVDTAREIVRKTSTHAHIPEPLRVSHIIASGITRGEASRR
ncbi:MAG: DUF99 family protein [Candidatus Methanofastidiosa archaeon]|nr:DUF99 family protein [Candidatus Methanofastidiosa archaeon]